jgi:hypothetical protein
LATLLAITLLISIGSRFYIRVLLSLLGILFLIKRHFLIASEMDILKDLYTKLNTLIKKI